MVIIDIFLWSSVLEGHNRHHWRILRRYRGQERVQQVSKSKRVPSHLCICLFGTPWCACLTALHHRFLLCLFGSLVCGFVGLLVRWLVVGG